MADRAQWCQIDCVTHADAVQWWSDGSLIDKDAGGRAGGRAGG
eukprot:SAG11_NODE_785_length_7173_cov_4.452926_8_plen_42_part_01